MAKNHPARAMLALIRRVSAGEARVRASRTYWEEPSPYYPSDFVWACRSDEELSAACAELKAAIFAADWGANGAMFVTRSSGWPATDLGEVRQVFVNGRHRAILRGDDVRVFTSEEAETAFSSMKTERAARAARYEAELERLGRRLWRMAFFELPTGEFGISGWAYTPGQCGGVFRRESDGVEVSAPGAFKRARKILSREGAYHRR